jgi:hypothetical protein
MWKSLRSRIPVIRTLTAIEFCFALQNKIRFPKPHSSPFAKSPVIFNDVNHSICRPILSKLGDAESLYLASFTVGVGEATGDAYLSCAAGSGEVFSIY